MDKLFMNILRNMVLSLYKIIVWIVRLPDRVWHKSFNSVFHWCFKDINGYLYRPHELKGLRYTSIGYNTRLGRGAILTAWDEFAGYHYKPSIHIGNHCHIGDYSHITACHSITISDNLLTGRYVCISDNAHGEAVASQLDIPPSLRPLYVKGPVMIGNNVWIGEAEFKSIMSNGYNVNIFIGKKLKSTILGNTIHQVCLDHVYARFVKVSQQGDDKNANIFIKQLATCMLLNADMM